MKIPWEKIEKTDKCWNWKGYLKKGYGTFRFNNKFVTAHRAVYETLIEIIPAGLELDHLCRNKSCVNPKHLEPVTHYENVRRAKKFLPIKTHCAHGHEYTPENTLRKKFKYGYYRKCRICKLKENKTYRNKHR